MKRMCKNGWYFGVQYVQRKSLSALGISDPNPVQMPFIVNLSAKSHIFQIAPNFSAERGQVTDIVFAGAEDYIEEPFDDVMKVVTDVEFSDAYPELNLDSIFEELENI